MMNTLSKLNDLEAFIMIEGQASKIDFEVALELFRILDEIKESLIKEY